MTKFNIKLLKDYDEDIVPPQVEYENELTMGAYFFARIAKQMKEMADVVTISVTDEFVKFDIDGEKSFGSIKVNINTNTIFEPDENYNPEEDQPANAKYYGELLSSLSFSTRFLHVFSRVASLSSRVSLKLSNRLPLLVEFPMEYGQMQYYLCPKY